LPEFNRLYGPSGIPAYAAVSNDGDTLMVAPAPDTTYTLDMTYLAALDTLNATNTSNWVLASHPDIYLFGSLVEAEPYVMHDARVPMWKSRLDESLEELRKLQDRKKYGDHMIARPARALGV